jgi:exosome complex RNA-binding protein Rrp4
MLRNSMFLTYLGGIIMPQTIKKNIHMPTLGTIKMVEKVLKGGDLMKIAELKRRLPKKVMHNTLLQILDYLQESGRIIIGTKGILWIYAERKELDKLIRRGTEV